MRENRKQRRRLFLLLAAVALIVAVWSSLWLIALTRRTLDQRVQAVAEQLTCQLCQGQSVADSQSALAQQMRDAIRQQLQQGRSEQEIIQYFASRYGSSVVWSPPWQGITLLTWLVPITSIGLGALFLLLTLRDWRAASDAAAAVPHLGKEQEQRKEKTVINGANTEETAYLRSLLVEELAEDDALFEHYRMRERSWESS
ncbi:MAG: cytochrome c-type biogenesis protein CcmH [Ktedonobacteraceae bacterium]|nr:cytochrome c-type biogenesis protein CcmH [Ktedonobacteraceae bacterium]